MIWNTSLFYDLGAVIGIEARALWLAGAREMGGRPFIGLDAWSVPVRFSSFVCAVFSRIVSILGPA